MFLRGGFRHRASLSVAAMAGRSASSWQGLVLVPGGAPMPPECFVATKPAGAAPRPASRRLIIAPLSGRGESRIREILGPGISSSKMGRSDFCSGRVEASRLRAFDINKPRLTERVLGVLSPKFDYFKVSPCSLARVLAQVQHISIVEPVHPASHRHSRSHMV
jgi:hypothetical protein